MLSAFGLLSLSLASVGLYGVLAFMVNQSQREIAIRIAVGAQTLKVWGLIFRHGFLLVTIGLVVGGAVSFACARLLQSQLLGVSPNDPAPFIVGTTVLFLVAFIACYGPARRATRVDPITALRVE